jgi:hypothetical protein
LLRTLIADRVTAQRTRERDDGPWSAGPSGNGSAPERAIFELIRLAAERADVPPAVRELTAVGEGFPAGDMKSPAAQQPGIS